MWTGFRNWLSRMIGGIRALLGLIPLMLFVTIGLAIMGGIYIFGWFNRIVWAGGLGKGTFPRPHTELHYSHPRISYTASALERQIESAE